MRRGIPFTHIALSLNHCKLRKECTTLASPASISSHMIISVTGGIGGMILSIDYSMLQLHYYCVIYIHTYVVIVQAGPASHEHI